MRKFSITDKLIIASFLISIVIIMIVASYSFYNAKDAILDRAFNQLNSVRVIKTNLIDKFFLNCKNEVQLASVSSDIQSIVQEINAFDNQSNYQVIEADLQAFKSPFLSEISKEYYSSIYIITNNKFIYPIKSKVEHDVAPSYDLILKKTIEKESIYVKDYMQLDSGDHACITFSSKIKDLRNRLIGIVVFEILPQSIDLTMSNNAPSSGLGASGESYLVGPDYLLRSSSRFQTKSVLKTYVKTEATKAAFANLSGTKVLNDYRGIAVLSSYGKIAFSDLNWAIIAEIDYQEVIVPIYKIRNEIIFISIFIFLVVLVLIIVLSRKITYPIQRLNHAAQEVGAGNFDVEIHHISNDEIGELSDTFNQMIRKLKTQTDELELEKSKSFRSLINGQESERQRLSRELHDSLGQLLIGLKLKYESCLNKSNLKGESFTDLGKLFDQTIEETRRISNNLMPAALSEFGLTPAIRNMCNEIAETTNINLQFKVEGSGMALDLEVKTYLFRIIQEALTNIIKHARAKNASVSLIFTEFAVFIHIEDDGKGFNPSKTKGQKSNGLNNISDRVSLLSGKIFIASENLKGTKINIEIPINTVRNG